MPLRCRVVPPLKFNFSFFDPIISPKSLKTMSLISQYSTVGCIGSMKTKNHVIGHSTNFWLFNSCNGYDLTHPESPNSPLLYPRLTLKTTRSPITIAPNKSAIVIIDMQNFFLSPAMGKPKDSPGLKAEQALLKYTIPAARRAGIQLIWVTWGITGSALPQIPPTVWRIFGYDEDNVGDENDTYSSEGLKKEYKTSCALGEQLGNVTFEDGSSIDAGRMLMRDQWNTELHRPLAEAYDYGVTCKIADVRFHKDRLSGLWEGSKELKAFLKQQKFTTLLFAGVNTDQCVLATLQDANLNGYDTILLEDCCGTTSPNFAKQMVVYNCQKSWGFVTSGQLLDEATQYKITANTMSGSNTSNFNRKQAE